MIESQIDVRARRAADACAPAAPHTLEVREEAQAAYNAELDRMTEGTVWVTGGCTSYYIDRNGHNSALWPTYTWPFRRRLRRVRRGRVRARRARAQLAKRPRAAVV